MDSTKPNTDEKKAFIKDMVDREVYELHFHYRAHYISADYYDTLDRRLTYFKSFCGAVGTLSGSKGVGALKSEGWTSVFSLTSSLLLPFGAGMLTHVFSSHHAPADKKGSHRKVAKEMKILRKKMEVWLNTIPETETVEGMLNKYNEFLDKHSQIEDEISSEDWTFERVHDTLPDKWKKKGQAIGKFFPERSKWYHLKRFITDTAQPILLSTVGTLVVVYFLRSSKVNN